MSDYQIIKIVLGSGFLILGLWRILKYAKR
jgi:hypothetical protein